MHFQIIEAHHLSEEVQGKETTEAQLGPRHLLEEVKEKKWESTSTIESVNSSPPLRSGPRMKITKRKRTTVTKTDNVRHPMGFEKVTVEGTRRKQARKSN